MQGQDHPGLLQMFRCEMSVSHCHRQTLMTEDALEGKNVADGHDEVAGERAPDRVGHLPVRKVDTGAPDCFAKR